MFCSKCGNEVAVGAAFCSRCGNPVKQSSTQPADPQHLQKPLQTMPLQVTATAKKKLVLPIAIAAIVIAVIAVAIVTGGFGLLDYATEEYVVSPKDTVEEYTWEELSTISAEIATASDEDEAIKIAKKYNLVNEDGMLDGTQTKVVTLTDGTVTSVQIAGFLHDDKSDGSGKAGITFIFTDAISEMYMNSHGYNDGGWEFSEMRIWLASGGKALLPEELQDVIVAVDKSTNNVGGYIEETDDVSTVVTTTSDELWLFSYVELVGELDESWYADSLKYLAAIYNAEGSQYKLFSDCDVELYSGSSSFDIFVKTYLGDSCSWWQRTPHSTSIDYFCWVYSDGDPDVANWAINSGAVVPGFCI